MTKTNKPVEVDRTTLRYALYVRKSSEDKGKQVRSLNDQIKDCMITAERNRLHVVGQPFYRNEVSTPCR